MCAGVDVEIESNWHAAGPTLEWHLSTVRTARVFQFPSDPAQCLLREFLDIVTLSTLDELRQSSRHEFSAATVGIGLEAMPVTIAKTQATMKLLREFRGVLWPARFSR